MIYRLKNFFVKKKIHNYIYSLVDHMSKTNKIIEVGSGHGLKSLYEKNLKNSIVISCGLGNDSTFDNFLIDNYNCKVFVIDPTPDASHHYNKYLKSKNTKLINCAIYNKNSLSKFYIPVDKKKYTSHSLKNFDGKAIYSNKYFYVKTKTLLNICKENKIDINKIEVLKLDVEGVGFEIIKNIFIEKIYPKQIHIEIEQLIFQGLTDEGVSTFLECVNVMNKNGYSLIKTKKFGEFLFVRNLKIKKNNYFKWQKILLFLI